VKAKAAPVGKLKELTKAERLDQAMKAYKWWEHEDLPAGKAWNTLEHNCLAFPPAYVPHGVPLFYDGSPVELTVEQEEVATFYALCPEDGPQLGDPTTRHIFRKNFFDDFKKILGNDHAIKKFDKCNFERIREHLDKEKLIKKTSTSDEKAAKAEEKQEFVFKFGISIVDGHLEKVGNTMAEPPGLFRGRGKHPLMGKAKQRITPEQVSVNIGDLAKVPQCAEPGHAWGRVQHDDSVTWLASWHENILKQNKYVMLAAQSSFKGKSDRDKYAKAMRLKGCIGKIRADYKKNLGSKDEFNRQLATAMWVIDILALRVGGEKGEDEADTVGCCSLRVEHLNFGPFDDPPPPSASSSSSGGGERHLIELEFLGKDSMLYKQVTDFDEYAEVGLQVYRNFERFCKHRKPADQVLDKLEPTVLNKHLAMLMPGLSAKVFRTYNASETLQQQLPSPDFIEGMSAAEKVLQYNEANKKVAILCNHQKTVSKAQEAGLQGLGDRLTLLVKQKQELVSLLKVVKKGKVEKSMLKDEKEVDALTEKAKEAIEAAKAQSEKAKTGEEKIAATKATEAAKELQKKSRAMATEKTHLFSKTPSEELVSKRVEAWSEKIRKLELDIQNKDNNKEVSLGTSKINYCDPRISVAWCKANEVPIDKIFAKTLRDKFVWALFVPPAWEFKATGN